MKFRIHAKNANIVIKGKPSFGEKINEREVDYLEKNTVPGFFQITYDGKKQLTYEAPACVTLEKYLKEARLEEQFFWKIMAQMLDVELAAQARGLYPVHLVMNRELIFIEEETLRMHFIYQPVTGAKDVTDSLFALVHDIIYEQLKKNGGTGPDYLIDFQNYLQRGDYRLEHIRQYIGQAGSLGAASGAGRSTPQQQAEEEEPEQYTVMLGSGTNADSGHLGGKKSIQITRLRTKERTSFSGDVVKMGRSNQNTYCIVGNTSIGRSHAAIVRRGDVCYLKDMGSVNGTSVNGRRLSQNQACRLQSGDRIQLADEEFVFELK
ncbi:MAG: FHA domain-containing protein [Eubacterium sp.]|nr:FHA domain-containing protein [Eubacterium sp.]